MALETGGGFWFVLHHEQEEIARFAVDPPVLRGVLDGRMTLQFSDGEGNAISVEGGGKGLKVRLEGNGHSPKNCRISNLDVEKIKGSLIGGV